ncbi:MAG: WYL domain-containing protein [Oscillospiraceae bacterium]|nr:WYL domain-containing protein [Oscillospiraceae bacterium]
MPKATMQKFRAIEILRILQEETDSDHPITTHDFCQRLEEKGITCDRRTLSDDISDLVDLGYAISSKNIGKQKGYFYYCFMFSNEELKVLIDAVQASSFIPEKQSNELMEKLAKLGGYHRQEVLKGNMVTFNTRKHKDESIMQNVRVINDCISRHKKISFHYYDLDENKKKRYRKNRKRYVENPAALVYNDDKYYLVCYSDKYQNKVIYRVDRMYQIGITEENVASEVEVLKDELPTYTKQTFGMFGGETEEVTLQFDRSILGQIYDQFGEETEVSVMTANLLKSTVKVQISPAFWGWLFQFRGNMSLISPSSVKRQYELMLSENN